MKHKLQDRVIFHLAKNRKTFLVRLVSKLARKIIKGVENCSYDTELNGEEMILQRMGGLKPEVFFDVGANRGDWSTMVRRHFPSSSLHCFEIAPAMQQVLENTLKNLPPPVYLNRFGLSDHSGVAKLNFCTDDDGLSTLFSPSVDAKFVEVQVPVETGDTYIQKHSITRIDFLKLDVEGAENLVLEGFSQALKESRITVIQFEYSRANIMSGFLLRDFYQLLEPAGYAIGKIFPNGVDFRPYSPDDENFFGPNFLAVQRKANDLITQLS
jgi:FkbM family methyltransferase